MQYKMIGIYGIVIAFLFLPPQAYAAAMSNLTSQPKTFLLQRAGGYEPITLEAGRTWRTFGRATLLFGEREIVIEEDMEYAIWPDDVIGPQRNLRGGRKL